MLVVAAVAFLAVGVHAMLHIPEAHHIFVLRSRIFPNQAPIPVRLPGKSALVHQAFKDNYLAVRRPALHRACAMACNHRPHKYRTLRVNRLSLFIPELVPCMVFRPRNLMPVKGLKGDIIGIVKHHFIAHARLPQQFLQISGIHPHVYGHAVFRQADCSKLLPGQRAGCKSYLHSRAVKVPLRIGTQGEHRKLLSVSHGVFPCFVNAVGVLFINTVRHPHKPVFGMENLRHFAFHHNAVAFSAAAGRRSQIARLFPEILTVRGVNRHSRRCENRQRTFSDGIVNTPCLHGKAHQLRLPKCGGLLLVQTLVWIPASPRLKSVPDFFHLISQNPHGMGSHRKHIGHCHRGANHERYCPIPYPRGAFHTAYCFETAPAPAVDITIGSVSAIKFGGQLSGKLRAGRAGAVH